MDDTDRQTDIRRAAEEVLVNESKVKRENSGSEPAVNGDASGGADSS